MCLWISYSLFILIWTIRVYATSQTRVLNVKTDGDTHSLLDDAHVHLVGEDGIDFFRLGVKFAVKRMPRVFVPPGEDPADERDGMSEPRHEWMHSSHSTVGANDALWSPWRSEVILTCRRCLGTLVVFHVANLRPGVGALDAGVVHQPMHAALQFLGGVLFCASVVGRRQ